MPISSGNASPNSSGQWVELPREFRFTLAGIFLGAVRIPCIALLGPLGRPAHPLTPSLFDLLPEGARAVYISSQSISRPLPRVSRLGSGICYVPLQGKRFFIDLGGTFESYLGKFSAKTRNTMRRKIRRLTQAEGDGPPFRQFSRPAEMADFHQFAVEVSGKGYQHRLLRAGIDPSPQFRDVMVRRAADGGVRGYILFLAQQPIAYMFCQARFGDLVVENMGFDPAFRADSPGLVLLCLVLKQLFAEGEFRRLDLGEGVYPYKEHLATGAVDAADVYCFPATPRNVGLVALHAGVVAGATIIRHALESVGLAHRLKKAMRYRAGRICRI